MRNLIIAFILSSFLLVSCNAQEAKNYKILDSIEYEQALTADDVQIVDVRTAMEFKSGHIEGAINMNVNSNNFKEQIQKLDKSKTVYIYCKSGSRSYNAGKIMGEEGFEVYDLKGGIRSWKVELTK